MRILSIFCACVALAGCEPVVVQGGGGTAVPARQASSAASQGSLAMFRSVVAQVEPVAERICRARTRDMNCDFQIKVETSAKLPPNAYQSVDANGRPIIGFTAALIADVRNPDELAFVMGHEAAHHIAGHIPQTQQRAIEGALLGSVVAAVLGGSAETVQTAQRIGGTVGARRYAKEFELQADALGTVITARAGFDPVRGAEYFARIPDPGNQFLGTHPPNAQRIATVRRAAASL